MSKRQPDALLAKTMLGTAIQNIFLLIRAEYWLKANTDNSFDQMKRFSSLSCFRENCPYL